jgi:hypothetical protein
VAKEFVCVRLTRISGFDLNLFEFDYDQTWAAFFINADGKIYGRYGGRDATSPDTRNSLKGLRYALEAALTAHKQDPTMKPNPPLGRPMYAESYPTGRRRGCIHCHNVHEMQRDLAKRQGQWTPEQRYLYPLPENVGLTLEVDRGNIVKSVTPQSPAAKVGLQPGDVVLRVNGNPTSALADVQYGLHKAPAAGKVAIEWRHDKDVHTQELELAPGWKQTDISWRPSLRRMLPSLPLYGDDLNVAEKTKLGLQPKQMAFRQDRYVPRSAVEAGLKAGDIVVGVDNKMLEVDVTEFVHYIRRSYMAGDQIMLNVLRDGKRLKLPLKLRAG